MAAIIVGAGDALGSAIAKAFASAGLVACVSRRTSDALSPLVQEIEAAGLRAEAFPCDARKEEQVQQLFRDVEARVGLPVEVVVHNIGANVYIPFDKTSAKKHFKVWEMAAFSAFLVGREAALSMKPRGKGTIIFTGATASTRGSANFSAFSAAMHAKRAMAQSLARELGPEGVHVAHIVIDGPIKTNFVRDIIGQEAFDALDAKDGLLLPEDIAQNYVHLHKQRRNAWTHELDIRPWCEKW